MEVANLFLYTVEPRYNGPHYYGLLLQWTRLLHRTPTPSTVSYTHLDVYKRQVYISDHSTVVKAVAVSRKK